MSTYKQPPSYPLRLPENLRKVLAAQAEANKRSLNAEIVALLEVVVAGTQPRDDKALAEMIAALVVEKLKAG